jgi:O-antigen/teichoic acid export membrane protein
VELVLRCVLDSGSFAEADRRRAAELVAQLRTDPVVAGRVAELVQRELAPALSWSAMLAAVVQERWDDLLERSRPLARRLRRRRPATARWSRRGTRSAIHEGNGGADESRLAIDGAPASAERPASAAAVSREQIRGSSLFLVGRGLGSGLKFAAELIVVRYLATDQYGAWTYALAAVAFLRGLSTVGLNRAIARYLPLHLERGEIDKFYGVLAVVVGLLAITGTFVIAAFFAFPRSIAGLAGVATEQPLEVLFILIFLVPVETIDNVLTGVCAALGVSKPIFVRRFLLHPGLRLAIAVVLVLASADVEMLAYGYLLAGVVGVGYYAWAVVARLRRQGLLRMRWVRGVHLPLRTVLGYTTPVIVSDWCGVLMVTAGPLLLGAISDMSTVALYQVAIPVAALNHLVPQAFVMLFEPSASRLVARGDRTGLERLYWRTAMWVSVLSFPLFALSFTAAVPLTVLLFGERYAAAAPILSLLAFSQFAEASAGFNAETLRVNGKIRWLIVANIVGLTVLVGVSVALIPSMGALGAGIGTAAGQLCYTILRQTFIRVSVGVRSIDPEHAAFYVTMASVAAVFVAIRFATPNDLWIIAPALLLGVLAVFLSARTSLSVTDTFPELARIGFLRKILG